MLADTDAIASLGSAAAAQAADLAVIASTLASLPTAAALPIFGPVGAGFLTALAEAARHTGSAVADLGDHVAAAGHTAGVCAGAYDDANQRSAQVIAAHGACVGA